MVDSGTRSSSLDSAASVRYASRASSAAADKAPNNADSVSLGRPLCNALRGRRRRSIAADWSRLKMAFNAASDFEAIASLMTSAHSGADRTRGMSTVLVAATSTRALQFPPRGWARFAALFFAGTCFNHTSLTAFEILRRQERDSDVCAYDCPHGGETGLGEVCPQNLADEACILLKKICAHVEFGNGPNLRALWGYSGFAARVTPKPALMALRFDST
jgi:hypothetical protein